MDQMNQNTDIISKLNNLDAKLSTVIERLNKLESTKTNNELPQPSEILIFCEYCRYATNYIREFSQIYRCANCKTVRKL
jgi:hypothetical protein